MTKRYYYDDPLAAMWMAKHFDMRFADLVLGDDVHPDWYFGINRSEKFYIAPESEALLEPMVGDVIHVGDNDCNSVFLISAGHLLAAGAACIRRGGRIIQRNGKAFIWPLIEEEPNS